jgi:hypothetical protein
MSEEVCVEFQQFAPNLSFQCSIFDDQKIDWEIFEHFLVMLPVLLCYVRYPLNAFCPKLILFFSQS